MRAPRPMILSKRGRNLCLFAILAILAYFSDRADAGQPADNNLWRTVSNSTLDKLRGGFDIGGGLQVSFGITRTVYINGALITETTLSLGELSQLTPAQASQLNGQLAGLNLVQVGPGNSAPSAVANMGAGTVIQNTLSNQQINVQTLISASSNGLGMVRNMNVQGTIDDALARAIAPR